MAGGTPAQAGVRSKFVWVPAFAGMHVRAGSRYSVTTFDGTGRSSPP